MTMSETMNTLLVNLRKTHKELTTVSLNYIQRALDTLRDDEMFYFRKELDYDGLLSEIRVKDHGRLINGILKDGTIVLRQGYGNEGNVHDGIKLTTLPIGHLIELIEVLERGNYKVIKWNFPVNKRN
jgi:hypothetical protein